MYTACTTWFCRTKHVPEHQKRHRAPVSLADAHDAPLQHQNCYHNVHVRPSVDLHDTIKTVTTTCTLDRRESLTRPTPGQNCYHNVGVRLTRAPTPCPTPPRSTSVSIQPHWPRNPAAPPQPGTPGAPLVSSPRSCTCSQSAPTRHRALPAFKSDCPKRSAPSSSLWPSSSTCPQTPSSAGASTATHRPSPVARSPQAPCSTPRRFHPCQLSHNRVYPLTRLTVSV